MQYSVEERLEFERIEQALKELLEVTIQPKIKPRELSSISNYIDAMTTKTGD